MAYLRAFFSLFPAHAGVIPPLGNIVNSNGTFPRTRGGDPYDEFLVMKYILFSPHTRG